MILDFYRNKEKNVDGLTLEEIWELSDERLMHSHDKVQWLFPLCEPSSFNDTAPTLAEQDVAAFRQDAELQQNLLVSFHRFLRVLGLKWEDGVVVGVADAHLWEQANHNWLRLTRIMKSLILCGLREYALGLFAYVQSKATPSAMRFSMPYWQDAVR